MGMITMKSIFCSSLALLAFLTPAFADIDPAEYSKIVAARNAEKEALLAESPFVAMRDSLFARYVRDPEAKAAEGDVAVDATWTIVQPESGNPVAVKMAGMLAGYFKDVLGIELAVAEHVSEGPHILLNTAGGGKAGVAGSFSVAVKPGLITVAGVDTAGLRDGIVRLIDLFGFRMAPFLAPQDVTYTPRIAMRRSSGAPTHEMTMLLGGNTVSVGGGELYAFSSSDAIPELAVRRTAGSREALQQAAHAVSEAGLDAHAHFGIREKFAEDDPIFEAHPEIRGARTWSADGEFTLCTEHPLVQQFLEESMESLFRDAPDLDGIEIIIGGENFYHCFMRPYGVEKGHTNCPRCDAIGPDVVVSNLVNRLARAARRANPNAVVEAWPYSAGSVWSADKYQTGFIQHLEPGTAILTESVKDMTVEKPFGISKLLWDYSIDLIGPGERARHQIELCNEQGIPTTVLSMYEMSFEAALLPEIPCMDRWAGRAEGLAGSGADGVYLWKMGPYFGGISSEAYKHFLWAPAPEQNTLLEALAARMAGFAAGPHLRKAWKAVSDAIEWTPEIPSYYKGALYIGPAQPMIADKAAPVPEVLNGYYLFLGEMGAGKGLKGLPTYFTEAPGGKKAAEFLQCYERMLTHMEKAVAAIDEAEPLVPAQNRMLFDSQAWPVRWLYHSVRTQVNFCRSCLLRDEVMPLMEKEALSSEDREHAKALLAQWRAVLTDELENTRAAAPIPREDVRLDCYYRGDHMFNHLWDMVAAKEELLEDEITRLLPAMEERLALTGAAR
jgi:hypothetical protein